MSMVNSGTCTKPAPPRQRTVAAGQNIALQLLEGSGRQEKTTQQHNRGNGHSSKSVLQALLSLLHQCIHSDDTNICDKVASAPATASGTLKSEVTCHQSSIYGTLMLRSRGKLLMVTTVTYCYHCEAHRRLL